MPLLYLLFVLSYVQAEPESSMCLASPCIHAASAVLNALNPEKDPCDDFYEFACGGWIKNNPIPKGKSHWNMFSKTKEQNDLILKTTLEKANASNDGSAESKAKIYYDTCLDSNDTTKTLGATPLLDVMKRLGGWHLLPVTMIERKKINLQELLQQTHNRYNSDGLFTWSVIEDSDNSSQHVISLDHGVLSFSKREDYFNKKANKKKLDAHLKFMTKICVLFGANETEAKEHMQKVIDFEAEIAEIMDSDENAEDVNTTVATLQNDYAPFIDWLSFFNDAFNIVNKSITENERIVLFEPSYFRNLSTVIAKYTQTDEGQKIITSYMMWKISRSMILYLSFPDDEKFHSIGFSESQRTRPSPEICLTDTSDMFYNAIEAMFVRDAFHSNVKVKTHGEMMINYIRNALKENLKNLRWMDAEMKKAAEMKIDAITDMIGFPDYILHPTELNKMYEDLEVKPNQYFQNRINVILFSLKKNFMKLDQPVDKEEWGLRPSTMNAQYKLDENQIEVPSAIFKLPHYDEYKLSSVNYGSPGFVMGHELVHSLYFLQDRFENNQTIDQFEKRTSCFQDQYSNFTLDGMQLNGTRTLTEDLADNGGLRAVYHAYLDYSRDTPKNYTLPGLNYSHRQLFFISFAQTWCSSVTKEEAKRLIKVDIHTLDKYRVIGTLSNLKEFSQEFQCPLGSNMNPTHKCELW